MIPGHVPNNEEYEELMREAYAGDTKTEDKSNDANYECCTCGNEQYVDDYQMSAPAFCDSCECVKQHRRIDRKV